MGRDQETAVVDHQKQSADPLARSPGDLLIRGFEVRICPAEAQQGHPLVIGLGYVAEAASAQAGVVEVVMFLEQLVETGPFAFFGQPDARPAHRDHFGAR